MRSLDERLKDLVHLRVSGLVLKVISMLQKIDPPHPVQPDRTTAAALASLRIHRRNQRAQIRPRHHLVHLGEKCVATRRLSLLLKPAVGLHRQGHLLVGHRIAPESVKL